MNISEQNSTNDLFYDRTKELDWIIPIAINIALLLASLWVMISLIHYGVKSGKWRPTLNNKSDVLDMGLVYTSVVVCAVMCFLRYIFTLIHMNVGFAEDQDELCDTFSDITSSFYAFVLFAVAMFLWARQKTFYTSLLLKVYYAKPIRLFGGVSIFVIITFGVAVVIFSTVPNDHPSSYKGCTYQSDDSLKIAYWVSIVFAIGFGQVSLLCLFAYALRTICHSKNKITILRTHKTSDAVQSTQDIGLDPVERLRSNTIVSSLSRSSSNVNDIERRPSPQYLPAPPPPPESKELVKKVLRLTLIFAVTALLTDILIQVISLFVINPGDPRRIVTTLLNINAFLNLLFVIFSFIDYKKMIFSPCARNW